MKEKRGIVNQQNAGLFLFVASLLAFIGPHSRMYCGYALYSPVYYLPVSQTIDDERYFFGVFSDAHQDSDKLTRVALTRGMKKMFC